MKNSSLFTIFTFDPLILEFQPELLEEAALIEEEKPPRAPEAERVGARREALVVDRHWKRRRKPRSQPSRVVARRPGARRAIEPGGQWRRASALPPRPVVPVLARTAARAEHRRERDETDRQLFFLAGSAEAAGAVSFSALSADIAEVEAFTAPPADPAGDGFFSVSSRTLPAAMPRPSSIS